MKQAGVVFEDRYKVYTLSHESNPDGEWVLEYSTNNRVEAIQNAERIKNATGPQIQIHDVKLDESWEY